MKLAVEIIFIWLAINAAFVLQRIYIANKREQFTRWHERECSENCKRWGMMR